MTALSKKRQRGREVKALDSRSRGCRFESQFRQQFSTPPPPPLLLFLISGWWVQCLVLRMRRKIDSLCATSVHTLESPQQRKNFVLAKLSTNLKTLYEGRVALLYRRWFFSGRAAGISRGKISIRTVKVGPTQNTTKQNFYKGSLHSQT